MRLRTIPLLVSIATALAACEASGKLPPPVEAVHVAPLAADLALCRQDPVNPPDRDLAAGEVERLWKSDRARLAKVNACFGRVVCQYETLRAGLAKAGEVACSEPEGGAK